MKVPIQFFFFFGVKHLLLVFVPIDVIHSIERIIWKVECKLHRELHGSTFAL